MYRLFLRRVVAGPGHTQQQSQSQTQQQQHAISPDKGRADDMHSEIDDDEDIDICVDETDDEGSSTSAKDLKEVVEAGACY